jgi:aminoacrylate hydrolase
VNYELDCRGCLAQVEVAGEGPDVVMVGAAAPMSLTRPAANVLADLGFRVTNFDYGSGQASPTLRTALDQVPDVAQVMEATGLDTAHVVGVSRGAMTAFGFAAMHPSRVARLVLVAPVAGFADTLFRQGDDSQSAGSASDDTHDELGRILRLIHTDEYLDAHEEAVGAMFQTPPGSVDRVARAEETPFPDDMYANCPTLVIESGADLVVSADHPARYLRAIPDAEHVVVPHGSHGWILEQPMNFARIVAAFVGQAVPT